MAEFVKGYLINPFLFLFLISFGLIIFRRAQRWSLILVVSLFYMVSAPITYTIAMKAWNISDTKDFSSPYDIAVVLTGMVDFHWYRSGKIKFPTVEYVALNGNRDRIFAGIHFLKSGFVKQLYFGELSVGSLSETEVVRDFVLSQGIEKNQFIIFGPITNTRDEAVGVRTYLASSPPERILLITNEIHMRRALDAFHKEGLYPDTFSVKRYNQNIKWQAFLPSPGGARAFHKEGLRSTGSTMPARPRINGEY